MIDTPRLIDKIFLSEKNDYINNSILDDLNDRIESLKKAGNELRDCASRIGTVASGEASVIRRTQEAIEEWNNKTK